MLTLIETFRLYARHRDECELSGPIGEEEPVDVIGFDADGRQTTRAGACICGAREAMDRIERIERVILPITGEPEEE